MAKKLLSFHELNIFQILDIFYNYLASFDFTNYIDFTHNFLLTLKFDNSQTVKTFKLTFIIWLIEINSYLSVLKLVKKFKIIFEKYVINFCKNFYSATRK